MKEYKLVKSVYQEEAIDYIHDNPILHYTKNANYILKVNETHWLYQFTKKNNLWYAHYDPKHNI